MSKFAIYSKYVTTCYVLDCNIRKKIFQILKNANFKLPAIIDKTAAVDAKFIGENVFIGPFCGFYTASHPINYADRNKGLERALPIRIGDNCWFGANVSVMQGVTIGTGCVIAAGSVVTKDVPENCLVAGVPATIKKRIGQ